MPRVPSQGSFLRFYVLLGLALCIVFLISIGGRTFIEQVRREEFREELTSLPMTLMTRQLAALAPERRAERLETFARQFGMQLTLIPVSDAAPGYFEAARLKRGRPVIDEDPWQLRQLIPGGSFEQGTLLSATLMGWSERQWQASVALLGDWLGQTPQDERPALLSELRLPHWPLTLLTTLPEDLTTVQRQALARGEVVTRLVTEQLTLSFIYRVPESDQWLKVGPIPRHETMPLGLHLPLLIGVMAVLSLIIYLIMRSIEARMARLELAATRIASGRLETRVKVESGDFLGRLGMAFNAMASQVQTLLKGQQEMIRAVSHELRTPVARIRFAVQMVEDMTEEPSIRHQLQGIDADIAELDDLVDEILTYARLGGGPDHGDPLDMVPVECSAMANRVIDALTPLHKSLSITLEADSEIELLAEPRYLQRALQNLVSNACRHGRSQVVIRVWDEPQLVRFDVEDDGPGVPVEARSDIFKPFARLDDSRARSSGGYGLGLSIVQKVMSGHGGSVTVDESPKLGGARFTLLIPRRESPA
ncbi:ATP-binding protein [Halomonas sp. PAMB 3264]|uniref:ATP-binding protein n=1 Tax=Halomonas sp. PAMB 3264 TaxID=3075222 RepID=UPI00289E0728|nr:ATP-binding protein [Halomonas sp. PAMB 3264]WNL41740.1 ATP-binding protein [Halomonas sp. PAMB 3264]